MVGRVGGGRTSTYKPQHMYSMCTVNFFLFTKKAPYVFTGGKTDDNENQKHTEK